VANKTRDAMLASAIMRGDPPSTVPATRLRQIGGIMLPAGDGLTLGRSRASVLARWGTLHDDRDVDSIRVGFSTAELVCIQAAIEETTAAQPAAGTTRLAARVLRIIQNDNEARPHFHPRHVVSTDRLKPGILRVQKQVKAGQVVEGKRSRLAKQRDEEDEDEEDEEEQEEQEEQEDLDEEAEWRA
jgi:hypothetical protein